MRVVGIDPSLIGTGMAVLDGVSTQLSTCGATGHKDATLAQRRDRLRRLADRVAAVAQMRSPHLVVIEAPAFSRTLGHAHDRSGLWWLIVDALHYQGLLVAEVAPTARARYATGRGNAGKDEVLLAVSRRFPTAAPRDNNQADALVLAAMGMRHLGAPIDDVPATHRAALDKVAWPAGLEVAS